MKITSVRLPTHVYNTLKEEAKRQTRSLHSLVLLVLAKKGKQIEARNAKRS